MKNILLIMLLAVGMMAGAQLVGVTTPGVFFPINGVQDNSKVLTMPIVTPPVSFNCKSIHLNGICDHVKKPGLKESVVTINGNQVSKVITYLDEVGNEYPASTFDTTKCYLIYFDSEESKYRSPAKLFVVAGYKVKLQSGKVIEHLDYDKQPFRFYKTLVLVNAFDY